MSKRTVLHDLDARRAQKLHAQTRQSWSEVDGIYNSIVQGILDVGESINIAAHAINAAKVSNIAEIAMMVKAIEQDMLIFVDDLRKINKRHEGKTGFIDNEDDHALSLSCYNDYVTLFDRFRAIIFNPMLTITETLADVTQPIENTEVTHDSQ